MSQNFLKFFFTLLLITFSLSLKYNHHQLLIDFTCATAKDELEKHPEMRTIVMVELENNFPSEFSREVLKCLPEDVAKVIINPHVHKFENLTMSLSKETMVIYVAENVEWHDSFHHFYFNYDLNFPVVHHLSKFLFISRQISSKFFTKLLNVVQIYEENRKVIARSFVMTIKMTTLNTFETSQRENLSRILFPDKAKNLNGHSLNVFYRGGYEAYDYGGERPNCKWNFYLDIIAEKLNANLSFQKVQTNDKNLQTFNLTLNQFVHKANSEGSLDFFLDIGVNAKYALNSYNDKDWCFVAPLPKPYSITELILFMPMDRSCWMWLGITIAVSTLIWRISEGHWNFTFGAFSYFMGQAQLSMRIRSNRLTMKILLQILIFAIFIFSNGYQSLVTSFMLNPIKVPLLKTVDEVLESDLKIVLDATIFGAFQSDNPKYQKALEDGRVTAFDIPYYRGDWPEVLVENHLTDTQSCKMMKFRIEKWSDGKSWRNLYLVPEVAFSTANDLYVRPFHPLLDNFQDVMDRSLEAGLHQAWERFYYQMIIDQIIDGLLDKKTCQWNIKKEEEKLILEFKDIAPFFLILVFGFGGALLAFLCEIFHKDFVTELSREYFKKKFEKLFRNDMKVRKARRKRNQRKAARKKLKKESR